MLNEADEKYLNKIGYGKEDIAQIKRSEKSTIYKLMSPETKKIDAKTARKLLGEQVYLGGLGRSTFHFTAYRCVCKPNGSVVAVLFTSRI